MTVIVLLLLFVLFVSLCHLFVSLCHLFVGEVKADKLKVQVVVAFVFNYVRKTSQTFMMPGINLGW